MKSILDSRIIISALILTASFMGGCSTTCSTRCVGGEAMARPAIALRDVHFGFDVSDLTPTAKQTLKEDFANLGLANSSRSGTKLVLEGRADERGDPNYNYKLSEARAAEVEDYLVTLGASKDQFEKRPYGEKSPIANGSTPDAWALNRSVRVLVR